MTILLTGGTGYIASHTTITLLQAGEQVVLLDNLCNSRRDVVAHLEKLAGTSIAFVEGDVRDQALVQKTLEIHGCDAVVHFAGLKAVGESVAKPVLYYANNVQGTISLLQAMSGAGVRRMVFSSSATVYGEPQYLPYDEEHPTAAPGKPVERRGQRVGVVFHADLLRASGAAGVARCRRGASLVDIRRAPACLAQRAQGRIVRHCRGCHRDETRRTHGGRHDLSQPRVRHLTQHAGDPAQRGV